MVRVTDSRQNFLTVEPAHLLHRSGELFFETARVFPRQSLPLSLRHLVLRDEEGIKRHLLDGTFSAFYPEIVVRFLGIFPLRAHKKLPPGDENEDDPRIVGNHELTIVTTLGNFPSFKVSEFPEAGHRISIQGDKPQLGSLQYGLRRHISGTLRDSGSTPRRVASPDAPGTCERYEASP